MKNGSHLAAQIQNHENILKMTRNCTYIAVSTCYLQFLNDRTYFMSKKYISLQYCSTRFQILCWSPYAMISLYGITSDISSLNIQVTHIPSVMAKLSTFLNSYTVYQYAPKIKVSLCKIINRMELAKTLYERRQILITCISMQIPFIFQKRINGMFCM